MSNLMHASRHYRAAAASRSLREQEADVFRRATGALRAARSGTATDRVRALADNRMLWFAIRGLTTDTENRLGAPLRAELISIALAVQREMDSVSPNFDLLIRINENVAAGLVE